MSDTEVKEDQEEETQGEEPEEEHSEETDEYKPHLPEQQPHRPKATENASAEDWLGSNQDPDVFLSVPDLGIDRINLTVEDLEAHVNLHAKILDMVELKVGAHVSIKKVELDIQNVHAQAMLKVNLDPVVEIVKHLVDHPEILTETVGKLTANSERTSMDDDEGDDALATGDPHKSIEGKKNVSYEEADEEGEQEETADGADSDEEEEKKPNQEEAE